MYYYLDLLYFNSKSLPRSSKSPLPAASCHPRSLYTQPQTRWKLNACGRHEGARDVDASHAEDALKMPQFLDIQRSNREKSLEVHDKSLTFPIYFFASFQTRSLWPEEAAKGPVLRLIVRVKCRVRHHVKSPKDWRRREKKKRYF